MELEELKSYSQARQDLFAWLCRGQSNSGSFVEQIEFLERVKAQPETDLEEDVA